MKRNWSMKRMLAAILTMIMLITMLPASALSEATDSPAEAEAAPQASEASAGDDGTTTVYHRITFALPADMSEVDAENVKLPEVQMVEDGSLLSELPSAKEPTSVFTGWYYDAELTLKVAPDDVADRDMTLYPRFSVREGLENEMRFNYVAEEDVPTDYTVVVTAHNMSAEDAAALIAVNDVSRVEPVEFTLEPLEAPAGFDIEKLDLPEAEIDIIREAAEAKKNDSQFNMSERLEMLNLDQDLLEQIIGACAPDELSEVRYGWMDEETRAIIETAGIDPNIPAVLDLNAYYGLDPDDSPERYWREDLEMEMEDVIQLAEAVKKIQELAWANTASYAVRPVDGAWREGAKMQVEIKDTQALRFIYENEETDPEIIYYNFTIPMTPFNNMRLASDIEFIPLAEVDGVKNLAGLYDMVATDEGSGVETNGDEGGILTCARELRDGMTIAVYDGTLNADNTVDGDVGYFKILGSMGDDRYAYAGAAFTDVVFMPDVFPVQDDGSYDDGVITLSADALAFEGPLFEALKIDEFTTIDIDDYLCFYTETPASTSELEDARYGRITEARAEGDSLVVSYEPSTLAAMQSDAESYIKMDQVPIPLPDEQAEAVRQATLRQVEESRFAEISSDYITRLISGDDAVLPENPELADALKSIRFEREDGGEISIDELRQLAAGGIEVSKPTLDVTFTKTLEYFHGDGLRLVVSTGIKIGIPLNGNNKLEIDLVVGFEQEVQLGLDVEVDTEWDVIILEEVVIDASLRAGTYSGFGAQATVKTKEDNPNEDEEWDVLMAHNNIGLGSNQAFQLKDMATKLSTFKNGLDKIQGGGTYSKGAGAGTLTAAEDYKGAKFTSVGGSLPTKYSEMLSNDAEYIDLVEQELFTLSVHPGPLHIVNFSLTASAVIAFKLNAMIGFSVTFATSKTLTFHVEVFAGTARSGEVDTEKPHARVDFYVFGMVGLRLGIRLDARVGIVSTKFDSIGVVAEAGVYAELYGFLYMFYEWTQGETPQKGVMGSLLLEIGFYLDVNFKAQMGDGKLKEEVEIYSDKWPILTLGAEEVPVPFEDSAEDVATLSQTLEIPKGKSTVKLPDVMFGVDMMALNSGDVTRRSQDSKKVGSANYKFTINGREYTQYNEEHFDVTVYDLDGENGKVTNNHSFQYRPATNEIYVKPVDSNKDEAWGIITFTYRNESFGFSTMEFQRTMKIHWKGDPCSARVEFYLQREGTDKYHPEYDLYGYGQFDGFDGIEYDLNVNEDYVYQFEGYRLKKVDFPDWYLYADMEEQAWNEYEAAYAAYKKKNSNANYKKYKEAYDKFEAMHKTAKDYDANIRKVLKERKGTLWFVMIKNVTVVKLYFDIMAYDLQWYMIPEAETGYNDVGRGIDDIRVGDNIMQTVRTHKYNYEKNHPAETLTWYYYDNEDWLDIWSLCGMQKHRSEWKLLPEDMTMPDRYVGVVGIARKDKKYKVTWKEGNSTIREDELLVDDKLPTPPSVKKAGYDSSTLWWTWEDGKTLQKDAKMPARDVTLQAHLLGNQHTLTWKMGDTEWQTEARTGDKVAPNWPIKYQGQDFKKKGAELIWTMTIHEKEDPRGEQAQQGNDGEEGEGGAEEEEERKVVLTRDTLLPDNDVTIEGTYDTFIYKITWIDGDKVVRVDEGAYDAAFRVPDVPLVENEYIRWELRRASDDRLYYYVYPGSSVSLPDFDLVATTQRHIHDWKVTSTYAPTCKTEGTEYAKCTICDAFKRYKLPIDPEAHEWYHYSHLDKKATCVSYAVEEYGCIRCGKRRQEVDEAGGYDPENHTGEYDITRYVEATCTTVGHGQITRCKGCGAVLYDGGEIPMRPHEWKFLKTVKLPTCTEGGLAVYKCKYCDATQEVQTYAYGHQWYPPLYSWAKDYSTVKAWHICFRDSAHDVNETVVPVLTITKQPTCTEAGEGYYTATFTADPDFTPQTRTGIVVPKLGHQWGEATYAWSDDNKTVTATRVCALDPEHVDTRTAYTTLTVTVPATCEQAGKGVLTAAFYASGFENQTKEVEVPATGHKWGTPTYAWKDDLSECTATRVCKNDEKHVETETVKPTSAEDEATCTTAGFVTYTATFKSEAFKAQTKTNTIEAIGHKWGKPTYTWADDNSYVTASVACENDASHSQTELVLTTHSDEELPSDKTKVKRTYTATFTNDLFETQTKVVEVNKAQTEYTWADDYSTVTAVLMDENGKKVDEETVKRDTSKEDIVESATCISKGVKKYYSMPFTKSAFTAQTINAVYGPLEHYWGQTGYSWTGLQDYAFTDETLPKAKITHTCSGNGTNAHTDEVEADVLELVESKSKKWTCKEKGYAVFKATFNNATSFTEAERTKESDLVNYEADPVNGHNFVSVTRGSCIIPYFQIEGEYVQPGFSMPVCTICSKEDTEKKIITKMTIDFQNHTINAKDYPEGTTLNDIKNWAAMTERDRIEAGLNKQNGPWPPKTYVKTEDRSEEVDRSVYEWAEGVDGTKTLSELANQKATVKVKLMPMYRYYDLENEEIEEINNGCAASLSDFKQSDEISITIVNTDEEPPCEHEWNWVPTVDSVRVRKLNDTDPKEGAYQDRVGNYYQFVELPKSRCECRLCGDVLKDGEGKEVTSQGALYLWLYNCSLPSDVFSGCTTLWDATSELLTKAMLENHQLPILSAYDTVSESEVEILIPGTYSWTVGQYEKLQQIVPDEYFNDVLFIDFTPNNTELFNAFTTELQIQIQYDRSIIEGESVEKTSTTGETTKGEAQATSKAKGEKPYAVTVKLKNEGDVYVGDTLEFRAKVQGDKSLVTICWQKLVENEKTHEKKWVDAGLGERFRIEASKGLAEASYRVVLLDEDGEVRAEAAIKFPKIHKKKDKKADPTPEPTKKPKKDKKGKKAEPTPEPTKKPKKSKKAD